MKLLSVIDGTAGIYVPLSELSPLSGLYLPDVSRAIAERYAFPNLPNFSPEDLDKNGLQFRRGKFVSQGIETYIQSLNIYSDGILANCYSTESALLLLQDLLGWAADRFELRIASVREDQLHLASRLIVELEPSTMRAFDSFRGVFDLAAKMYQERCGLERPITISRFQFDVDRSTLREPYTHLPAFIIERQVDHPFSSNRFWCQAPLHTEDHIRLLEAFENITNLEALPD